MRRITGVLLACVVVASGQPAWAARTGVHEAAESQDYGRKFGGMIGRGVLNVATSFVDVIVHLVNDTKAGPPLVGTLTGIAKGTGCGVMRMGSGAVDLLTFWVPGFNGFPVSDSYDDCFALTPASSVSREASPPSHPVAVWSVPPPEPAAAQASARDATVEHRPAKRVWKK